MDRIERNGICEVCAGRIRYYPPDGIVVEGAAPAGGYWSHLDPADWLNNPHLATPDTASLEAAGFAP